MEDVEAVKDLLSYGSKQNIVRVPSAHKAVTVSPLYRALKIYYEKKLHKTDKFKNFIKNIESLRVQNQAENNMLLSSGGAETISQHKLPHNMKVKTLSLSENGNTSLALSSPMLPQQCNENFYLDTQKKDFSKWLSK